MFIRVCLITKRNFILICMFDVRSVWSVRPDPWTRISTRSSARADSWVLVRFKREICLGSFLQMILGFRKKWNCYLSVYPSVKKKQIFTYSVTETESCLIVLLAKKASKFRDWLDLSSLEVKPNSIAMEILSYLAYETVAQVTGCFIYQFTIAIRA